MEKMVKMFCVLVVVVFLAGCAGMAKHSIEGMQVASQAFDDMMTEFVGNWATISGAIDGAYEGRTFNVPSGNIELKEMIDKIVGTEDTPYPLSKYEKAKVSTLWLSIATAEVVRWLREFRPDILGMIPAALLRF